MQKKYTALKYVVSILLLSMLLAQPFAKWAAYVLYETNKEYYATELCEKKTVPDNCCEGSCYLEKQLAQAEEQEKNLPSIFKEQNESFYLQVLSPSLLKPIFTFSFYSKEKVLYFYKKDFLAVYSHDIFHPPLFSFSL